MKFIRLMVLGISTGIGKTYVSCALIDEARRKGLQPRAFKPVMSGFQLKDLAASDAGLLAAACGDKLTPDNFHNYCHAGYEEPASPNIAARRLARPLNYKELLVSARRAQASGAPFVLIEGAGGVLTPLTETHLNADLAADLNVPSRARDRQLPWLYQPHPHGDRSMRTAQSPNRGDSRVEAK